MKKETIDYKKEYIKAETYSKEDLMNKYKELLLLSSNNEEHYKRMLDNKGLEEKGEAVFITQTQLQEIKDSLERKQKLINDLAEKIKTQKNVIKKHKIVIKTLDEKTKALKLKNDNLLDSLDQKVNSNNADEASEEDLPINNKELRYALLKLNEKYNLLKEEYEVLSKESQKQNQELKEFDEIKKEQQIANKNDSDKEKYEIIKELTVILKSSNYDSDLIKRLQKQIKLTHKLEKQLTEMDKLNQELTKIAFKKATKEPIEVDENIKSEELVKFLKEFLPSFELFKQSLNLDGIPKELSNWFTGFKMVYRKFEDNILDANVMIIDPKICEDFNHNLHQAIGIKDETGFKKDQITEVVQRGYKYKHYLLRAALVKLQG